MTIKLLTQDEYNTLLSIQQNSPKLTFQNVGYEYINRKEFTEQDNIADKQVTEILKNHIEGFVRFDNFRHNKKNEISVRLQYHYSESFVGVGYVTLRELFMGFDEN